MEPIEVGYISLCIFVTAAYTAMSARWDIMEIPWYKFVRYPSYFGGRDHLLIGLGLFFVWCALSVGFGLLLAWLVKSSAPTIQAIYRNIGYDDFESGHAGLATLLFTTWVSYIYIVHRTYRITDEHIKKIQRSDDYDTVGSLSFVTLLTSYIDSHRDKKLGLPFTLTLDIIPLFLASYYNHFYDSSGILIRGCANLLHEKYGSHTIIKFYDFHKRNAADQRQFKQIDDAISRCVRGSTDHVRTILCGDIGIKGYRGVQWSINNYVKQRSDEQRTDPERRIERTFFASRAKMRCLNSGYKIKGEIVSCSNDGSGLFVSLQKPLHTNRPIRLRIEKLTGWFSIDVVHAEATYVKNRVVSGYGVKVKSEGAREGIATLGFSQRPNGEGSGDWSR